MGGTLCKIGSPLLSFLLCSLCTPLQAKYYAQPMTLDEIHREVQQAEAIKELTVKQIGFIAINGFVEREEPYFYLDGNDIFANE